MKGTEKPIPHRCLAFTPEGPWCPNMAEVGRSFCAQCLGKMEIELANLQGYVNARSCRER